jgi:hypothetical protein
MIHRLLRLRWFSKVTDRVRSKGVVILFVSEGMIYYLSIRSKGKIILFLSEEVHLLMFINLKDDLSFAYVIQC